MTDQAELKTYRGNCHCGDFIFEVTMPEIKAVNDCDCSACYKRGALWAIPPPGSVNYVKGDWDALTTYTFSTGVLLHKFCPSCGTELLIERQPKLENFDIAINARVLQNVDVWTLERRLTDGKAYPPAYEVTKFTGTEPAAELDGGQIYTGSCHCGAVTLAVKSKPLDKDFEGMIIECNCSLDNRYGTVWIYPQNEYVSIDGEANLTTYFFGKRVSRKRFCKTCGIAICSNAIELPEHVVETLPEQAKFWYKSGRTRTAVNLRALDGVDVGTLNVTRNDGWNQIKPEYVNP
ncbi:glutathione-dependent formaldehyde-activating enzyme [Xylariales sp. PMI_506]|nr:glutathione-dependent formaldehyde-activating enzyme [Xylariales sp. PMI_506]